MIKKNTLDEIRIALLVFIIVSMGLSAGIFALKYKPLGLAIMANETIFEAISLDINSNMSYLWVPDEEGSLTSLGMSGYFEGDYFDIYLLNDSIYGYGNEETEPIIVSNGSEEINLEFGYGNNSVYDSNNNGYTFKGNIIDFYLNAYFNFDVNPSDLCTKYTINSLDENSSNQICYGNFECCAFIGSESLSNRWNDSLYLNFGKYSAGYNNTIDAQVIYYDVSLNESNLHSYIYNSDVLRLNAKFFDRVYFDFTKEAMLKNTSYEFNILLDGSLHINNISYNIGERLNPINETIAQKNETISENSSLKQYSAVIGKPVKWEKKIKIDVLDNTSVDSMTVDLPNIAGNVSVKKIDEKGNEEGLTNIVVNNENKIESINPTIQKTGGAFFTGDNFFSNMFGWIKDFFRNIVKKTGKAFEFPEENVTVEIKEEIKDNETVVVEYYTDAPYAEEILIDDKQKEVTVFGPEEVHYEEVLAFSELPQKIADLSRIKLYWLVGEGKKDTVFRAYDNDGDGSYDYIEWEVPSLSSQKYEIIIEITKAELLDDNKRFLEDIYNKVKSKDENYAEVGPGQYIRVSFEQYLDNTKDITIYGKSDNNAKIEVYSEKLDRVLATIEDVSDEKEYKTFLSSLSSDEKYQTFYLKVLDGSVDIDYIVDPLFSQVYDSTSFGFYNQTNPTDFGLSLTWDTSPIFTRYRYSKGDFKSGILYNASPNYWRISYSIADTYSNRSGISDNFGVNISNPNLTGYWRFDNSLKDEKGLNNAVCSSCPSLVNGLSSQAYYFNGAPTYAVLGNLNVGNYDELSVSFWIQPRSLTNGQDYINFNPVGGVQFRFIMDYSGNIYFYIANTTVSSGVTGPTLVNSQWYHVVGTWKSGESPSLYINKVGTQAGAAILRGKPYQTGQINVGRSAYGGGVNYANAVIDEVAIFNKKLTQSEVNELYRSGLSQKAATNITLQARNANYYNLTDPNLRSLWSFNNQNANDENGRNNGAVGGSAAWNNVYGVVGGGYSFDGVDDYIEYSNAPDFQFTDTTPFSFSFWAYPNITSSGYLYHIRGWISSSFQAEAFLTSGKLGGTICMNSVGCISMTPGGTVNANKWNYITYTYNGNTYSAYINGVLAGSVNKNFGGTIPNTVGMVFGCYDRTGKTNFMKGYLDDIRFYNKVLTVNDITNLMNIESYHINWRDWSNEQIMSSNAPIIKTDSSRFMQFRINSYTNNTQVSPYIMSYSASNLAMPSTQSVILNSTNITTNDTNQNISCYANLLDSLGGQVYANYTWFNNSVEVQSLRNQTAALQNGVLSLISTLDAIYTNKNENWTCSVQAYNGLDYEGHWHNSSILTIKNGPPQLFSVILNSTNPKTNDTDQNLTCYARATDIDGDTINYAGDWYKNNSPFIKEMFNKTYYGAGNDVLYSLTTDNSGNIYVTGYFDNQGSNYQDFAVMKLYSDGNQIWKKTFNGNINDAGRGIVLDKSGNIYLCGDYYQTSSDAWLMKLDSNGGVVWDRKRDFGSVTDTLFDLVLDSNDNIYAVGQDNSRIWVVKYDSNGNYLWGRSDFAGIGYGIGVDSGGNAYIVGNSNNNLTAIKYDSNGNKIWNKTYGGAATDYGFDIVLDNNNNSYIIGETASFGAGSSDMWLVKLDKDGNKIWDKTYGGTDIDRGRGIDIDSSVNIYLSGFTASFGAGSYDAWLVKTDANGNPIWNITYGTSDTELSYDVSRGHDYIYSVGQSTINGNDWILLKYYDGFSTSGHSPEVISLAGLLESNFTEINDTWKCCVYAFDSSTYSSRICSDNLTILTIPYWSCSLHGMSGSGTLANPCMINSCTQLQSMLYNLSANYALNNNIDCSETRTWNAGKGFIPIGNSTNKFIGSFNGMNKEIKNLFINRPLEDYVGLFGYITNRLEIKNISMANVSISGRDYVGGLVGQITNYSISKSYITGSVYGRRYVGGLVGGTLYNSNILYSNTFVNITGTNYVGGLVGSSYPGSPGVYFGYITNSSSSGNVTGTGCSDPAMHLGGCGGLVGGTMRDTYIESCFSNSSVYYVSGAGYGAVGGLVGYNDKSLINNCYARGNVYGLNGNGVGGLVGYFQYSAAGYGIYNSYATGNVTSTGTAIGGLLGWGPDNLITIQNSYATGFISGGSLVGGIAGLIGPTTTVSNSYWYNDTTDSAVYCIASRTADACNSNIRSPVSYFYNVNSIPISNWSFPPWSNVNHLIYHPPLAWQLANKNMAPIIDYVILNTTDITKNDTYQNLTGYISANDPNGDNISIITNWYKNNKSIAVLNMPFEYGDNSTNAKDYSSYKNDGIVNGATFNKSGGYDGMGAYEFDGVDDYINLVSFPALENINFSFSGWINSNSILSPQAIVSDGIGGAFCSYSIYISNRKIALYNWNGANRYFFGNTTLSSNTWYHVAVVWNTGTSKSIYVNGFLDNTTNSNSDITNEAQGLIIGKFYSGSPMIFNGTIDYVQIYNYSLSPEQVKFLYNNQKIIYSDLTETGEVWKLGARACDKYSCSDEVNSSDVTILGSLFNGTCTSNITRCCNITSPGTYSLQNNISANGTCFNISANNVNLSGNYFTVRGNSSGYGIVAWDHNLSNIYNMTIANFSVGIYLQNNFYSIITDINALDVNSPIGIITGSNNIIAKNYLERGAGVGITLLSSINNTLENNIVRNFYQDITIDQGSNNNTVKNNVIESSPGSHGIYLGRSTGNKIIMNNFSNHLFDGISIVLAYNNLIENNIFSNNSRCGINLRSSSSNNSILNNQIYSNVQGEICDSAGTGVMNYLIYNNSFGEIRWAKSNLTTKGYLTFPGNISIINNSASFNSAGMFTLINSSANVTLNLAGWEITNPRVLKDNIVCYAPNCNVLSYSNNIIVFNVSSWSNYSIEENNQAPNTTKVILNSSLGTNYTDENLWCYASADDADSNNITYSGEWYKNGQLFVEPYWNSTIGGAGDERGMGIVLDDSENVYVGGFTSSFGVSSYDGWIIKYDTYGKVIWNKTVGGSMDEMIYGISRDSSNNVYPAGFTKSFGAGNYDCWFMKYDNDGNQIWNKTEGESGDDRCLDSFVDSKGYLYLIGYTNLSGNYDVWTLKYDLDGNQIWNRTFGGAKDDKGISIFVDNSYVYVAGSTGSYGAGGLDYLIIKYDLDGDQIWNRTFGGTGDDSAASLYADDSYIYATGYTTSFGAVSFDSLIVKYDLNGNLIWNKKIGGSMSDYTYDIFVDDYKSIYLYGETRSFSTSFDRWLLKYDNDGNQIWNRTYGNSDYDSGHGIIIGKSEAIYVAGSMRVGFGLNDVHLMKIVDGFGIKNQYQGNLVSVGQISDSLTKKGDNWTCSITSYDGKIYGNTLNSTQLTILNKPPQTEVIVLNSSSGSNLDTDNLLCYAKIDDADLDNIYVNYTWYNNSVEMINLRNRTGLLQINNLTSISNLSASYTNVGDNWTCSVQSYDESDYEGHWHNATLPIGTSCGNGIKDIGEECDKSDLNGLTCTNYSFDSGSLTCLANCKFDSTGCYNAVPSNPQCNDGIDNDNDNKIDMKDIGCKDLSDNDESDHPLKASGGGGCTPEWECTKWSECKQDSTRTRICTRIGTCRSDEGKPSEIETCKFIAPKKEQPKEFRSPIEQSKSWLYYLYDSIRSWLLSIKNIKYILLALITVSLFFMLVYAFHRKNKNEYELYKYMHEQQKKRKSRNRIF